MSGSQFNYVNDNTIGKRSICGAIGLEGKEYRKIKQLQFETVQLGIYAVLGAADGTEDLIGHGDNAQLSFYLSTIITDTKVYLYTATDENGTGMANFDTITISPFSSSASYTKSFNADTGKLVLSNTGVVALASKYLFASYKYTLAKGDFEIERRITDDSIYTYYSGVGAHLSHAVGTPGDELDGNFRHDRMGSQTNGTARRWGDIFVVRDKIKSNTFVVFAADFDFGDTAVWEEIIPIALSQDENKKYTKDASLNEGDVITVTPLGIIGQQISFAASSVLVANELVAKFPYHAVLSCPSINVALPISGNVDNSHVTIATGISISGSIVGEPCYIRKKKKGKFEVKNTVLQY